MAQLVQAKETTGDFERCPFCHDALLEGEDAGTLRSECARCGTPHHASCFVENGGCALMGCGEKRARRVGDLEATLDLKELSRAVNARVEERVSPEEKDRALRQIGLAGAALAAAIVLALVFGFSAPFRHSQRDRTIWLASAALFSLSAGFFWLRFLRPHAARRASESERMESESEREGLPCPECGTPRTDARDGRTFCYVCGTLERPEATRPAKSKEEKEKG